MATKSAHHSKVSSTKRGYDAKWQRARALFLKEHPLCKYCEDAGRVAASEVVDHIIPHRRNWELFWDIGNWQALCKPCHDSAKQVMERQGFSTVTGLDGWPLDPAHPVNKESGKKQCKSIH